MKNILVVLSIVGIIFTLSACRENAPVVDSAADTFVTTQVTVEESTSNRDPMDILNEADLSQDFLDSYSYIVDTREIPMSVDDFLLLVDASLRRDEIEDYANYFWSKLTPEEYICNVNQMKSESLTDGQIMQFKLYFDVYSVNEYIQLIKDMVAANLTEEQIDYYSYHSEIDAETYIQICTTLGNVEDIIEKYEHFSEKYTLKEFCDWIKKLRETTGEESATPIYWLSDKLVFVKRNISSYDYVEKSVAIMTLDGKIVTQWQPQWDEYDIMNRAQCGDYFFIVTKELIYNDFVCDVVNKRGKILSSISCKEKRYDIGEGYVFFTMGNDFGNIVNPKGEVIELQKASVYPSYGEKSAGALTEGDDIGKISEGLFYGHSIGNMNTVAYYYNTKGEVVIDLSTQVVNFKVTKMYDFIDGKAKIEFTGVDNKEYCAYIDKSGEFIDERL